MALRRMRYIRASVENSAIATVELFTFLVSSRSTFVAIPDLDASRQIVELDLKDVT